MAKSATKRGERMPFDDEPVVPHARVTFDSASEFTMEEDAQAEEDALLLSYNDSELAWLMGTNRHRYRRYLEITGALEEGLPPANTGVPAVTQDGNTLTCTMGTWDNEPTSYDYLWRIDGSPAGTVGAVHDVTTADAGKAATCLVTATNAFGATQAPASVPLVIADPSAPPGPVNISAPVCYATGPNMTTTNGAWADPQPFSFNYQWYVDGLPVGTGLVNYPFDIATEAGKPVYVDVTANAVSGAGSPATTVSSNTDVIPSVVTQAASAPKGEAEHNGRRTRHKDKDEDE